MNVQYNTINTAAEQQRIVCTVSMPNAELTVVLINLYLFSQNNKIMVIDFSKSIAFVYASCHCELFSCGSITERALPSLFFVMREIKMLK